MYAKGVGTLNVATGISLLSGTSNNHKLFVVAVSLLVTGIVIFAISTFMARKSRRAEIK